MAALPILVAVGTAFQVVSTIQQGRVASANAQSAANVADYNATVANNNAVLTRQQASTNEEAQRRSAALQLGKQRAGIAEAGGGLGGTSADLYGQSVSNAELDAKNILYMGDLKAAGFDSDASLQRSGAGQYRSNAGSAITGSYLSAAGAAFSGAGNYYKTSALIKSGKTSLVD